MVVLFQKMCRLARFPFICGWHLLITERHYDTGFNTPRFPRYQVYVTPFRKETTAFHVFEFPSPSFSFDCCAPVPTRARNDIHASTPKQRDKSGRMLYNPRVHPD